MLSKNFIEACILKIVHAIYHVFQHLEYNTVLNLQEDRIPKCTKGFVAEMMPKKYKKILKYLQRESMESLENHEELVYTNRDFVHKWEVDSCPPRFLSLISFTVDDCPQRFNDGSDPYKTELQIYVLGSATSVQVSLLTLIVTFISLITRNL